MQSSLEANSVALAVQRSKQAEGQGEICDCFCSRALVWAFRTFTRGNDVCEGTMLNEKREEGGLACVMVLRASEKQQRKVVESVKKHVYE